MNIFLVIAFPLLGALLFFVAFRLAHKKKEETEPITPKYRIVKNSTPATLSLYGMSEEFYIVEETIDGGKNWNEASESFETLEEAKAFLVDIKKPTKEVVYEDA